MAPAATSAGVISSFGGFVVGGNFFVGFVIFRHPRRHQLHCYY